MSNVLKVNEQQAIQSLFEKGWSRRKIAQELGMNRRTVSRYAAKCTREVTAGSESKCTTQVTAGSRRAKSACEGHRAEIAGKVDQGLSAQRIYQDLVTERGFASSYESVKRFVAGLRAKEPRRVWRMESPPGEEVQVDFGLGAMIEGSEGKRRRSWVLRAVLSHSRKGYSEAVYRQDTETFLRVLENAFRHFGGTPQVLNLDNLKAAVIKADWHDPEINPKLAEFCRHYGVSAAEWDMAGVSEVPGLSATENDGRQDFDEVVDFRKGSSGKFRESGNFCQFKVELYRSFGLRSG